MNRFCENEPTKEEVRCYFIVKNKRRIRLYGSEFALKVLALLENVSL
ncbi:hypothetical protein PSN82_002874 [Enterococcus faecalis]|nr:hypothetical protein [Enterococcus faecalis]EPI35161.1 hypothetical protein D349_00015 [Enterococcus faecalis UP2S-6]EJG4482951.1 hypothetical protein [Enterococcus faecalis]EKL7559187.1 hypothetical protein [Enterococcus faecalis]MBD9843991.1 hypothetical protein [Enterococcus faecalis]MDR9788649.1 hypothetical protein [Enterococcus faecalis]